MYPSRKQDNEGQMNLDTSKGHPAMDYREHINTYRGFVKASIWMSVLIAIILALMAYFLV